MNAPKSGCYLVCVANIVELTSVPASHSLGNVLGGMNYECNSRVKLNPRIGG
jgi:hypothetical protein